MGSLSERKSVSKPCGRGTVDWIHRDSAFLVSIGVGGAIAGVLWFTLGWTLPATESEVRAFIALGVKVGLGLSLIVLAALAPRYVASRVLRPTSERIADGLILTKSISSKYSTSVFPCPSLVLVFHIGYYR